jgi:hypothetical protein
MKLNDDILQFLTSPVMIIIGTRDAANRPAIARGLGASTRNDGAIEVAFCRWQWPQTARNIEATGALAVTCTRPSDYVSYQLKGEAALQPADACAQRRAQAYCQDIHEMLAGLGVPAHMVAQWTSDRDLVVARLSVREAYVQTPGARAGTAL